tara:strand:+ start:8134 stop:9036 length:903 start_codon:yes stop_codon:yes gene_type:complete
MDFKTAMAAARAEAESRQRKKRRDKEEKSEKKRSRSGEDMGLEAFDPVNYVAKERAETASMWLVLFFSICVSFLMRFGIMPSMNHGDSVLWLLPLLSVFLIPSIHRVIMPDSLVELYTKGTWFKASFLHIFTWLAITMLLVNPPFGDIGAPEVANQWTVVVIDENENYSFPLEGPGTVIENGQVKQLEIFMNSSNSNRIYLLFGIRDNYDVNNVDINMTMNGEKILPNIETYNNLTEADNNSTWENNVVESNRVEDVGYAVELENLTAGFWEFKLTLSESGIPWENISEEYIWTLRVSNS